MVLFQNCCYGAETEKSKSGLYNRIERIKGVCLCYSPLNCLQTSKCSNNLTYKYMIQHTHRKVLLGRLYLMDYTDTSQPGNTLYISEVSSSTVGCQPGKHPFLLPDSECSSQCIYLQYIHVLYGLCSQSCHY